MRGWHIERSGQVSTTPDAKSPEHVTDIITELRQETAVAAALPHEPLIPLKALMAFSPSFEIAPGLKRPNVLRQVNAHEAKISLRSNYGNGQRATHNSISPGVGAFFLALGALLFGGMGVLVALIGLVFEDFGTVLVGVLSIALGYLCTKRIVPNSRWRRRAAQQEERLLKKEQKINKLEEHRRRKAEENRNRKAKRQAFFQAPFIKIALGFFGIIGLYLLLF